MVDLDPPGTLCLHDAVLQLVRPLQARTFCEVGVGKGSLALALCRRGMRGVGIEFSPAAMAMSREVLGEQIASGDFQLVEGDFMAMAPPRRDLDLALSMMVMEHVEDDAEFARRLVDLVAPGRTVIVGVPARMDHWGVEDMAAGHFRRYERDSLRGVMEQAGLRDVSIRSVSVPIANMTFRLSNFLIQRGGAARKQALTQRQRTELSGLPDVPFKHLFPSAFKLLLNPVAMYPAFVLQRAFYGTGLGLTLVAAGRRPA